MTMAVTSQERMKTNEERGESPLSSSEELRVKSEEFYFIEHWALKIIHETVNYYEQDN